MSLIILNTLPTYLQCNVQFVGIQCRHLAAVLQWLVASLLLLL